MQVRFGVCVSASGADYDPASGPFNLVLDARVPEGLRFWADVCVL